MGTPAVIHNATIVTADETGSIHYDAALAVHDRRIVGIGPTAELLARYPEAERIDGRGRAVLPGFANTHTHLPPNARARDLRGSLTPAQATVHGWPRALAAAAAHPR